MRHWSATFTPRSIVVIRSESFFANPHLVLSQLLAALNIPSLASLPATVGRYNIGYDPHVKCSAQHRDGAAGACSRAFVRQLVILNDDDYYALTPPDANASAVAAATTRLRGYFARFNDVLNELVAAQQVSIGY